jgi:hypothetical protein
MAQHASGKSQLVTQTATTSPVPYCAVIERERQAKQLLEKTGFLRAIEGQTWHCLSLFVEICVEKDLDRYSFRDHEEAPSHPMNL